jgi:hypothetical protein
VTAMKISMRTYFWQLVNSNSRAGPVCQSGGSSLQRICKEMDRKCSIAFI